MKIAVCGSGNDSNQIILEKAKELGKEIAKNNHILLTGGCKGYPYAAVKGALLEDGKVVAISPAKDKEDHINNYNFPLDQNIELIYTGKGIPQRNFDLIKESDKVIILDGKVGTLMEFTIAIKLNRPIFVLDHGKLPEILKQIDNSWKSNIKFEKEVKEIIKDV